MLAWTATTFGAKASLSKQRPQGLSTDLDLFALGQKLTQVGVVETAVGPFLGHPGQDLLAHSFLGPIRWSTTAIPVYQTSGVALSDSSQQSTRLSHAQPQFRGGVLEGQLALQDEAQHPVANQLSFDP